MHTGKLFTDSAAGRVMGYYMGATETGREAELAAECARLRVVMMRCVDLCVSELSAIETCAEIAGMLSDELCEKGPDGKDVNKWDALGWPNTPESPQWDVGE